MMLCLLCRKNSNKWNELGRMKGFCWRCLHKSKIKNRKCSFSSCNKKHFGRGMCMNHYKKKAYEEKKASEKNG